MLNIIRFLLPHRHCSVFLNILIVIVTSCQNQVTHIRKLKRFYLWFKVQSLLFKKEDIDTLKNMGQVLKFIP